MEAGVILSGWGERWGLHWGLHWGALVRIGDGQGSLQWLKKPKRRADVVRYSDLDELERRAKALAEASMPLAAVPMEGPAPDPLEHEEELLMTAAVSVLLH